MSGIMSPQCAKCALMTLSFVEKSTMQHSCLHTQKCFSHPSHSVDRHLMLSRCTLLDAVGTTGNSAHVETPITQVYGGLRAIRQQTRYGKEAAPMQNALHQARRGSSEARRSGKRLYRANCMAQAAGPVAIRLKLAHQVKFGDRHAVIGSAGCLGSWRKHVDMQWSSEGWVVEINPSSYEKVLEYKFVIVLKDGGLLWESGGNRTLHVPDYGAYEVIAQWDTTQEEAQIIPDPALTMIWPPLSDEFLPTTSLSSLSESQGKGMDMYKQDRDPAVYEAELAAELDAGKKRLAEMQNQAEMWERMAASAPEHVPTTHVPESSPPEETPLFLSQRQSMTDNTRKMQQQHQEEVTAEYDSLVEEQQRTIQAQPLVAAQPERPEVIPPKLKPVEVSLPKVIPGKVETAPAQGSGTPVKPPGRKQLTPSQAERLSTLMALNEERKEIIRIRAVLMELSMAELRALGRERGVRGDTRAELVELLISPLRVTSNTNGAASSAKAKQKSTNGAASHTEAPPPPPPPPPPETEESRMKALSQKSMLELRTLAKAQGLRGDTKKELVQLLARLR
eukprot:TRINITY_DN11240_c0_g3_i1.p1 TRINITY_DN11240_c0_g3~~TRINITY_DN11240_c0_g3_i1.p1  ORF type:complete len:563 (+),score=119.31 TRINITY_DN11240_c0_g3_i1:324-2012(+)